MIAQATRTRFILQGEQALQRLQQTLPAAWHIEVEASHSGDAHLLDTFDGALWSKDQLSIASDRELWFIGPGTPAVRCASRKPVAFKSDIQDSLMLQALAAVPELRRLLPGEVFKLIYSRAVVVDEEQKTCARLSLWEVHSEHGAGACVDLTALRGYRKVYKSLCRGLDKLGAEQADAATSLFQTLGLQTSSYQSNPSLDLCATAPVIKVVSQLVSGFLEVARCNEDGILRDLDSEFLHDYRVSLRRVRSLVSLSKGVWTVELQQQLKQRFSALMRVTNRLRDLDVYLLDQPGYYQMLPADMHAGVDQIFAAYQLERRKTLRKLCAHLQSEAYQREIQSLQQLFSPGGELAEGPRAATPAQEYARVLIRKHYKRAYALAKSIHADTPDEEVHQLRLQCKKLRYLLDLFRPLLDPLILRKLIKSLKILQDNLGRFNDYSSQQLSLRAFLEARLRSNKTTSPEMIEAIGALVALKHQLQLEERARVIACCTTFNSPGTRQLFDKLTREPAVENQHT